MSDESAFQITVSRTTKHDLRTPLNQIIGYGELLEEELAEISQPGMIEDVRKMKEAAYVLLRAIDALFDRERLVGEAPDATATPPPADFESLPGLHAGPAAKRAPHEAATFLVVDDNEKNRDLLARRLKQLGYDVLLATDGPDALEVLGEATIDIVLLDIIMPGMSGLEVLAKIRAKHSWVQLPVIMATAKDHAADIIEALRLGANDYVTKPLNFPVLLARAETHLSIKRLSQIKERFTQTPGGPNVTRTGIAESMVGKTRM